MVNRFQGIEIFCNFGRSNERLGNIRIQAPEVGMAEGSCGGQCVGLR